MGEKIPLKFLPEDMRIGKLWSQYDEKDEDEKIRLKEHEFEFCIDDIGTGWEYVHIVLDGIVKHYRVSYIGPTVRDFVKYIFTMRDDQADEFVWLDEPGEYRWLLSRQGDSIYLEAPGICEGFFMDYEDFKARIRAGFEYMYKWPQELK